MFCQWSEAPLECLFRRCEGAVVFHRNPRVHRKWSRGEALDLANSFADSLRLEPMSPNEPSPP
jgi:hypothetical protein